MWLVLSVELNSLFMYLCVHGEKSDLLTWAIRPVVPDLVTNITLLRPHLLEKLLLRFILQQSGSVGRQKREKLAKLQTCDQFCHSLFIHRHVKYLIVYATISHMGNCIYIHKMVLNFHKNCLQKICTQISRCHVTWLLITFCTKLGQSGPSNNH